MAKSNRNVEYIQLPRIDGWMTTFSDMVTLLITFFVLMISMMSMDDKAFREVFGFFNEALGPLEFTFQSEVQGLPSVNVPVTAKIYIDTTSLSRSLLNAMEKKSIGGVAGRGIDPLEVKVSKRGLAIRVPGDILFAPGSKDIANEARPYLLSVSEIIRETDALVSVEGHTDDSGEADMNWRLSLERALRVLDFFVYEAGLSPSRFVMCGYGETRPTGPNTTEQGRIKNRRVEIILLRDRF